jgi:DNA ligase D-like protein (predicted ligase)
MTGGILALPPEVRARARRAPQPTWVPPMLATLTEERFSDPEWIFERKLDGERALTFRRAGRVAMLSRNRLDIGGHYPEVVEWLEAQAGAPDFVIDGEVVAFDHGQTSFAKLQRRMQLRDPEQARGTGIPVFYYVFDVIHAGGYDLTEIPLRHRKAVLKRLLGYHDPVRLTSYRNREGELFSEEACRKSWEGLIAKRAGSQYVAGRSRDWLKFKCVNEQEFVIGGFTEPKGSRPGLGALLIGYYEDGTLRYAGKVGTGFNERLLRQLRAQLDQLERATTPFVGDGLPRKGVHWVEPELVAEIGFTEWTPYGQLRHPRFLGLREDKPAAEVVRERPTRA